MVRGKSCEAFPEFTRIAAEEITMDAIEDALDLYRRANKSGDISMGM
jgi:hypothetical protein